MKALKALVLVMGLLLVAGLGLLGYGLTKQSGKGRVGGPVAATSAATEFGAVGVPVPPGSRVEQALVAGERVVLRLTGAGAERFVVLDPAGGRVAGTFVLTPEAPAPEATAPGAPR
ncbi:MAG: hypothetical protein ACM33T_10570 [Solirubrobacterales bacterium]